MSTGVLAMAAVLLVGCSAGDSSSADSSVGEAVPGPEVGILQAPGDSSAAADASAERQVITTASAALTVDHPADAAQQVSELVEAADGRVEQRSEQRATDDGNRQGAVADLVVRVPADALTDLLADLEEIGDVQSVSVSESDQTATAVDLDARITSLQTSVTRLQGLLSNAATTEALLVAEAALSDRQTQVESLQSRRALLADQVELSTLTLHLASPDVVAPVDEPDGFLDALGTGWRALVSTLGVVVVVLGVLLPWLVVLALVAAAVLVPLRRRRRRVVVTPQVAPVTEVPTPAPSATPGPPPA